MIFIPLFRPLLKLGPVENPFMDGVIDDVVLLLLLGTLLLLNPKLFIRPGGCELDVVAAIDPFIIELFVLTTLLLITTLLTTLAAPVVTPFALRGVDV